MPVSTVTITHSPEATRELGRRIGRKLTVPSVLTLCGDLGSGKTVFVQGLADGLDVPEDYYVTSPSYTLINEYPGRLILFHVDLYRLEGTSDFEEIGLYDILEGEGVVAIEWAERIGKAWNADRLEINIGIRGVDKRKITATAYGLAPDNLIKSLES